MREKEYDFSTPSPNRRISLTDMIIFFILMQFSLFVRQFRLQYPEYRVFDEVYFGNFSNFYTRREYFFDIHPPLGKLLYTGLAITANYKGNVDYYNKNNPYQDLDYYTIRQAISFLSSLTGPFVFISLRLFGYSQICSVCSSITIILDTMLIVEGRLALSDGVLHCFAMMTLLALALSTVYPSSKIAFVFVGLSAGFCLSTKYTGASVLAVIGVHQLVESCNGNIFQLFTKMSGNNWGFFVRGTPFAKTFWRFVILTLISVIVLFTSFSMHILILKYDRKAITPKSLKGTFVNKSDTNLTRRVTGNSLGYKVVDLISLMHVKNMGLTKNHSMSSKWYNWPLMNVKTSFYFTKNQSYLALTPTGFIWIPAAISPLILTVFIIYGLFKKNHRTLNAAIFPIGYYASWIPFALIPRTLFAYHYLIPLMFGIICFPVLVELLTPKHKVVGSTILTIYIIIVFISWIYYSPWLYAMPGYVSMTRKKRWIAF